MFKENDRDIRDKTASKDIVTWYDFEEFINFLAESTDNFKNISGVYGPPRGGVTIACVISNRYGLSYLGAPQKGCLIVDDIVDTGATAQAWKEKGYTIASIYYNKSVSTVVPDYYWKLKEKSWIEFPWECNSLNIK